MPPCACSSGSPAWRWRSVGGRDPPRPFSDTEINDLYVYRTYAELLVDGKLPYLDFGFEYPPLAALPIWLGGLRGVDEPTYATSFDLLMLACALLGQQLVARLAGGGRDRVVVALAAWC